MSIYVEKVKRLADAFARDESKLTSTTTAATAAITTPLTPASKPTTSTNKSPPPLQLTKRKRTSESDDESESKHLSKQKQAKASNATPDTPATNKNKKAASTKTLVVDHQRDNQADAPPPRPSNNLFAELADNSDLLATKPAPENDMRNQAPGQALVVIKDTLERSDLVVVAAAAADGGSANESKKAGDEDKARKKTKSVELALPMAAALPSPPQPQLARKEQQTSNDCKTRRFLRRFVCFQILNYI